MARLKRTSAVLETARQRHSGMVAIGANADLGPNLTEALVSAKILEAETKLNHYNGKLSELDQVQNEFETVEEEVNQMCQRLLAAGKARYGPDSNEYEMLGGTRSSDRKKPSRKGGPTDGDNGGGSTGGTGHTP